MTALNGERTNEQHTRYESADVREPRRAVGNTTVEAMRIGAVTGYRGLIREIVLGIRRELDPTGKHHWQLIATGGQAAIVARGMPEIQKVDPLLTLKGLQILGTRWLGENCS